jgi:hypothetical protein
MYFLQYSRDKEDENGQAFLGINRSPLLISSSSFIGRQARGEVGFVSLLGGGTKGGDYLLKFTNGIR